MSYLYKLAKLFKFKNLEKYCDEVNRVNEYIVDKDTAIELENISFIFEDKTIIDNFNYKFKKNKVYGIVGPSGSGKTALSNYFNGINKCNTGNVYLFNGEKICFYKKKIKNYREIRQTVGMVLQFPEYQLFKETVLEDVSYGLKMCGIEEEERNKRAKNKLLELGMPEYLFGSSPFALSGGQKRKVALSGILAIDPQIIIFDEPTIGLDPYSQQKVIELIKELRIQQKTIVIISNNVDLIYELSDEVLVLDKGKLIDSGSPMSIFRNIFLNVGKPKIVRFIEKLTSVNKKFDVLWEQSPKNVDDLSECIANVVNK